MCADRAGANAHPRLFCWRFRAFGLGLRRCFRLWRLGGSRFFRRGDGTWIGEALRVSPGTGSFGQGTVGSVGEDAAVLFLLATRQGYEIWGTVLQCR